MPSDMPVPHYLGLLGIITILVIFACVMAVLWDLTADRRWRK